MKKKTLTLFLTGCFLLLAGCEKSKQCETYRPWPTAEATSAWKDYSPDLLDDLESYNDVSTALNYFGHRPSYTHDSVVSMHNGDSVLICGYLNLWRSYGSLDIYMLTEDYHATPIDTRLDDYITVNIHNNHEPLDTLRKAFISAQFVGALMPEEIGAKYCCSYTYHFKLNTADCPIRYKE